MKKISEKKGIFILSFIILVMSFLKNWYADQLCSTVFLFVYFPFGLCLKIFYIFVFIFTIRKICIEKWFTGIISIALLVVTLLLYILFPFREIKIQYELDRYEAKRIEIINKVINREFFSKDEYGNPVYEPYNLKLPLGYKKYSSSGEITVYQNNNDGVVIGFWIYRGMLSGSIELIYSTGEESLIRKNENGHPIREINKLGDKWYLVYTDY